MRLVPSSAHNARVRLRLLICPDKFKGSLSATEASEAIATGWRRIRPGDRLDLLPVSDGGDGFGEICAALMGAQRRILRTVDASGRPIQAPWWWCGRQRLALLESARIIGLALLPRGRFHPFELDTLGLGQALRVVVARGAACVVVGLGGSATNDGGFGMARALGWRFFDKCGHELNRWVDLWRLHEVRAPIEPLSVQSLAVAVDVSNPLLGARGATRIFGPQKGMRPSELALAERCLRQLARVMEARAHTRLASIPGSGAAGGLGFGFLAFTPARLIPGFAWMAGQARLETRLRAADLVITGEGSLDRSSLMGKGVGEIARLCARHDKPCWAFTGQFQPWLGWQKLFQRVEALIPGLTEAEAMMRAKKGLEGLAARAARSATELAQSLRGSACLLAGLARTGDKARGSGVH
ncbi:MAG: glycerate kinase [Verrucomicrobiota bacterium]|nr:glycerate kinase [Limisphaera sp.]MDW8380577.1 glycerate kinase [Verrucomicrobiota bacterium]